MNAKLLKLLLSLFILFSFYSKQVNAQYYAEFVPYRKGNLWGFCDWRKKIIVEPQYQEVKLFINELAKVKKKK